MTNPQHSAPSDRTGPVASMLQSVDALGANTGRLFERLYGGLRRKSRSTETERATQATIHRLQEIAESQSTDIARLTGVLAVISEGVIMQDNQGAVVLMNQAARDLIGSTRACWDSDLGRCRAPADHARRGDHARQGAAVEINDRVIGAQLAIVGGPAGNRLGTVLMLRDVTRDALSDRLKDQFVTQ